jgi:hypothetical protein
MDMKEPCPVCGGKKGLLNQYLTPAEEKGLKIAFWIVIVAILLAAIGYVATRVVLGMDLLAEIPSPVKSDSLVYLSWFLEA